LSLDSAASKVESAETEKRLQIQIDPLLSAFLYGEDFLD
jgi:hypothetical protein